MYLVQQFLCFENQSLGLYLLNRLCTKSCLLQHGPHLPGQRIATLRKGHQLILKSSVGAVLFGATAC